MGKRNVIFKDLYIFLCEHTNDKTGKTCNSHLHLTNHYSSTLEFKCYTCGKYTCMSYEVANVINNNTGRPPKREKQRKGN